MLIIRKEQFRTFEKIAEKQFEDRMVVHLQKYFHEKCSEVGEEGVRGSIEKAVFRTRELGLKMEYDIERFLNHMYTLGFDFDTNLKFPWAEEVFSDPDVDPSELMDILSERTQRELEQEEERKGQ